MEKESRLQQQIFSAIHRGDDEVDALRRQIHFLNQKLETRQYRGVHPVTLGLVAGFLILFGFSVLMFHLSARQPRAEMLFEQYFEPFVMDLNTRGGSEQTDFERSLQLYGNHDYRGAISAVSSYAQKSPEVTYFVTGLCYLQMGLPDLAIKNFDLAEQDALYFKEAIWWYKALTYVKKNEKDVAGVILTKLVRNGGAYKQGASELLAKLSD